MISEALRLEVAHLGIKVTCIEPGYFRTGVLSPGNRVRAETIIDELAKGPGATMAALDALDRHQPGDPAKGAAFIVEALTTSGRAEGRNLPPRLVVGSDAYEFVAGNMKSNRANLELWEDLATSTDYDAQGVE